jgi:hypothetical protein
MPILVEAAKRLNVSFEFTHEFAEGEYVIIENGRISEWAEVPMPRFALAPAKNQTSTSAYGAQSIFEKGGK